MGIEIVRHKGKEVVYFNYKDMDEDQMIEVLKEGAQMAVKKGQRGDKLHIMVDVTGAMWGLKFHNATKKETRPLIPYVRKAAITGVTTMKGTMLDMYNRTVKEGGIRSFGTFDEGMDWLAK